VDVLRELIPCGDLRFAKAGELVDTIVQPLAQIVVAELNAVHRNNRKLSREAAVRERSNKPGTSFARSSHRLAKNDEHSRFELVIRLHDAYFFSHSV